MFVKPPSTRTENLRTRKMWDSITYWLVTPPPWNVVLAEVVRHLLIRSVDGSWKRNNMLMLTVAAIVFAATWTAWKLTHGSTNASHCCLDAQRKNFVRVSMLWKGSCRSFSGRCKLFSELETTETSEKCGIELLFQGNFDVRFPRLMRNHPGSTTTRACPKFFRTARAAFLSSAVRVSCLSRNRAAAPGSVCCSFSPESASGYFSTH